MKAQNRFKTSSQVRRENLIRYIDSEWGGKVITFSEYVGRSRQQIYKMLSDPLVNKVHRAMGSLLARELEQQLNLECGYFDHDHALVNASQTCRDIAALTGKQQKALKALIASFGDGE